MFYLDLDAPNIPPCAAQLSNSGLMQEVFAKNLSEYEFLGDDERYKLEWATGTRRDVEFTVVNRKNAKGWWLWLLRNAAVAWRGNRDDSLAEHRAATRHAKPFKEYRCAGL